ncbi:MAG: PilW family protein [Patescibacteria group bacterium]
MKKGFTLIEILIAVGIFMIIASVITGAVVFGSDVYQKTEEFIELTQNGRVVLNSISREIRQAERIVTSLPDTKEYGENEIIFEDGHLDEITEKDTLQDGGGDTIFLSDSSSDQDGFYDNSYIKITNGPAELVGETRKITDYDGETKKAQLDFPFEEDVDCFGVDYMIDTSYYVHYYLEDNLVKRAVYGHYFSSDPDNYVPIDASPPEGETLEVDLLESRTIGEHFNDLRFWKDQGVNTSIELELNNKEINLFKKVSARNL